jgi:threonine dehydrogenase-like Zn-dependent dehydrogenase
MKALHLANGNLNLINKKIPEPDFEEALIRVTHTGICNTDLELLKGYLNFTGILGHEFVGIVEKTNDFRLQNKRVVGEINLECGQCSFCLKGMGRHCPTRTVLGISGKDGAFAEYITLPKKNLHVLPEAVSDLQAVFIEPLAAACRITEQLEILPEHRVLVIGDGKLGQLIAQVVSLYTEKLLVLGKHPEKLQLLEQTGIKTVLLEKFEEPDLSFQMVIEATGSWNGWHLALKKVAPRGFLVLKSTYEAEHTFNPAPLVINEINIIGSRCGPFPVAINLLLKGVINPTELISGVYKFDEWKKAFKLARAPQSLKIILDFTK